MNVHGCTKRNIHNMLFVNMELKKKEKDPTNQSETHMEFIGVWNSWKDGKSWASDVLWINIESGKPKTKQCTNKIETILALVFALAFYLFYFRVYISTRVLSYKAHGVE